MYQVQLVVLCIVSFAAYAGHVFSEIFCGDC